MQLRDELQLSPRIPWADAETDEAEEEAEAEAEFTTDEVVADGGKVDEVEFEKAVQDNEEEDDMHEVKRLLHTLDTVLESALNSGVGSGLDQVGLHFCWIRLCRREA